MKILAIESSATAASVALCQEEELLAQTFLHSGFTHSQTVLPMVDDLLKRYEATLADLDLLAVAVGPGSFTGLRIGVATVKGLAWASEIPCAACSTLESMAWNLVGLEGEVCAAMDARRGQIYHARFHLDGVRPHRITQDRAISLEELAAELHGCQMPQWIVGDGAQLCYEALQKYGIPVRLAPPHLRIQSAWGVARLGLEMARSGQTIPGGMLRPVYHRLSQAERERMEKEAQRKP